MGKRSKGFKRSPKDYYVTPRAAVLPLLPHLNEKTFIEPCAGNYALAGHLEDFGLECFGAYDIDPKHPDITKCDAFYLKGSAHTIITNPPWTRNILHPMIEHFRGLNNTWLLFDADWAHTKQAIPYLKYCRKIVSVGRVKWFGNTTGKDNAAWYNFGKKETQTIFFGRSDEI